ncbi:hypothetical protein PG989_006520 [Apiospora arundinis]
MRLNIQLGEVKPELGPNAGDFQTDRPGVPLHGQVTTLAVLHRIRIVTATGTRTWWAVLFSLWGGEAMLAENCQKC